MFEKKGDAQKFKNKKNNKRINMETSNQFLDNGRKRSKHELIFKTKVEANYNAASFALYVMERRHMQSETLSVVFDMYFCILKCTMHSIAPDRSVPKDAEVNGKNANG
ncbi:hypothetical protein HN51_065094 [Arachis hypogaea]|uniref:Uncharacterized protein n=1 Tax=Arachis hypogaea TaxID=3818 RepID=A0A444ZD01_ARAHY|nr:hypothetical protein Ahy_B04g069586 [Arachis hypogaea]